MIEMYNYLGGVNQSIIRRYQSKVRSNNILDKSQQSIIDYYQSLDKKRMLVSAPTSYGKTFIMREILYLNQKRYNNVLLVFPTVALLRENALNMEELNREKEMGYKVIKSIDGEINSEERNIFVFTPERAMQLLANYPDMKIDFFFYDEMYKIDEDYCNDETDDNDDNSKKNPYTEHTFLDEARAKTFRICLYILSKRVEDYYLAGPSLKRDKFGKGMQRYIATNDIKIKEIEFEPTKRIQVKAYNKMIDEDYTDLPYLEKPELVKMHSKVNDRICDVVEYIEKRGYGATMLYCTTPSKANEYATKLAQRHQESGITNKRFSVFVDHLKRNYNIDRAYMDAFKTQKEIIEYKIPKMLALFETIFLYASSLKGVKLNNFSLSKVTRFFETGVKSYFGEQLVEFGFPVDAIKRIEDCNVKLVSMNADLSKKYIQEHLADIKKVLDTYEKELLDRALKSIF